MKALKRILIIIVSVVVLLAIGIFLWGLIQHEPLPEGTSNEAAEKMAQRVEKGVNQDAWDATEFVSWTFGGKNSYAWDRKQDVVVIEWGDKKVILHTPSQRYSAYDNDAPLSGDDATRAFDHAWSSWCNDSYWLQPIDKIRDPGVTLSVVELDESKQGLKVTHSSGGVTPGDSYVYLLDDDDRPYEWRMWVSIIPVGGMPSSWTGWKQLKSGAWISTVHSFAGKEIELIKDLSSGSSPEEIGKKASDFVIAK